MRLLRSILVLYHASMALRHTRLSAHHVARADALLVLRLQQPESASRVPVHPVERILLGSIVGLGIAGLWIMLAARAAS